MAGLFLQEVCSQYWPETGGVTTFGEYTIDNLGEESNPGFMIRQLSVLSAKVAHPNQLCLFGMFILNPLVSESSSSDPVPDSELE